MKLRREIFQAIADLTRRDIIRYLSAGRMNINAVTEKFDISRPSISRHIKILVECGLIDVSS